MSKKKGMSIEEKIVKVEEYFHENPVPFTLKELMVNIPKSKGVIFQSIEECIEVLVSEGRVRQEKIGISVFYWHFPVNEKLKNAAKIEMMISKRDAIAAQTEQRKSQYEDILRNKFGGDMARIEEAQEKARRLQQLNHEIKSLEIEIAKYANRDPVVLQQLEHATAVALEGANRWTDNIFLIEDYVTKRMGISRKHFREMARIPQQLDFLE